MHAFSARLRSSYSVITLLAVAALFVGSSAAREGSTTREPTRNSSRSRSTHSREAGKQEKLRLREGTVISDQSGFFREDGDGATFVADTSMEFGALPNLNLERVVRLLKSVEEPSGVRWSVTGKVTEFSGRNFLLISRAVYKASTPPPLPDRIVE